MSEIKFSRCKLLKLSGLTVGVALVKPKSITNNFVVQEEILNLNSEQQKFMTRYGKYMDEFIEVISKKTVGFEIPENGKNMFALTEINRTNNKILLL